VNKAPTEQQIKATDAERAAIYREQKAMGKKEGEEEMVSITKKEYDELKKDSAFLACLEGAGVDNWCGYDDAREMMTEL
jgi:hypothetical protein